MQTITQTIMHTMQIFVIHYPLLLLLLAIAGLVAVGLFTDARERKETKVVLRHTISVNLGILRAEYAELTALARTARSSAKVTEATALLASVGVTSGGADSRVQSNSSGKLQQLLTDVFGAMDKSSNARQLLDACHPMPMMNEE